jgi:hypothetical protein
VPPSSATPVAAALPTKEKPMLETLIVVLVVLWLLGMVSSYTVGGFIHILLVIAVVVLLLRMIRGRRVL